MEKLINELIKAGCARDRMEIKVFGGGNVTDTSNAVGSENAEFVLRYLEAEGLRCAAQDLGGRAAAAYSLLPGDRARGAPAARHRDRYAVDREEQRLQEASSCSQQPSGDIELFGED